jgi:Prophage tail fibre N-terminal.
MLIKSLQIGLVSCLLCAANAWAGSASIQGIVKDAHGKPIKNADIRVESRDGKQVFGTAKTDSQGRYISQGLQPGVYRVSLVVNGAVKAAISNTKARSDQATQLNFDLRPATATAGQTTTTAQKKKHMVWVPAGTGSHMGGRWVEEPDGAQDAGTLNVKRASSEQLRREMLQSGNPNTGN